MASQHLVGLALQQLLPGAVSAVEQLGAIEGTGTVARVAVGPVLAFLRTRFTDQSAPLMAAIEGATDRAWRALELVAAGDSLWDRLKGALAAGDMKAFRHDVRGLLAAAGVEGGYPVDLRAAARELRAARAAGLLRASGLTPAGMVNSVGVFARFSDPSELAAAQWRAVDAVAEDLKAQGYPALAAVAAFRPGPDTVPLLGIAVRYFFRRAVERDAELARGLEFARMESLAESQRTQFRTLDRLVTEQGERLDAALGELAADVAEVKAVALDIRAEQERLGDQNRQLMEAVLAIQAKLDQAGRTTSRPRDSLSIRSDVERQLVRKVIAEYRGLSESDRAARPALQNAVGLLEVAAGDFAAARNDFAAAAESVTDPRAKGVAHMNAYRAALEARDWAGALREVLAAARCDGARLAPFPLDRYLPERILGAGGFGVAFLCKHKYMNAPIVVKTLSGMSAEGDYDTLFAEARAAAAVPHPGIVRVTDCGYIDPGTKDRAFVVMDYFPGSSLDEYVRERGVIHPERLVSVARQLAETLGAAHAAGILHRDVKPGNVLVRAEDAGFEVRVIDFGLAVRHRAAEANASTSRSAKTLIGESIAGTVDYAAPEQMGRGGKVGPYSDVYGWAKTCCFALFQTAQPTLRHWRSIPVGLAELLGRCLEEDTRRRPQSFAEVVQALKDIGTRKRPKAEVPVDLRGKSPQSTISVVAEVARTDAKKALETFDRAVERFPRIDWAGELMSAVPDGGWPPDRLDRCLVIAIRRQNRFDVRAWLGAHAKRVRGELGTGRVPAVLAEFILAHYAKEWTRERHLKGHLDWVWNDVALRGRLSEDAQGRIGQQFGLNAFREKPTFEDMTLSDVRDALQSLRSRDERPWWAKWLARNLPVGGHRFRSVYKVESDRVLGTLVGALLRLKTDQSPALESTLNWLSSVLSPDGTSAGLFRRLLARCELEPSFWASTGLLRAFVSHTLSDIKFAKELAAEYGRAIRRNRTTPAVTDLSATVDSWCRNADPMIKRGGDFWRDVLTGERRKGGSA